MNKRGFLDAAKATGLAKEVVNLRSAMGCSDAYNHFFKEKFPIEVEAANAAKGIDNRDSGNDGFGQALQALDPQAKTQGDSVGAENNADYDPLKVEAANAAKRVDNKDPGNNEFRGAVQALAQQVDKLGGVVDAENNTDLDNTQAPQSLDFLKLLEQEANTIANMNDDAPDDTKAPQSVNDFLSLVEQEAGTIANMNDDAPSPPPSSPTAGMDDDEVSRPSPAAG